MKKILSFVFAAMFAATTANATVIFTQGFESASTHVAFDADSNYDLAATNNGTLASGASIVLPNVDDDGDTIDLSLATSGTSLGYTSTFTNSIDGSGLSDGDFIGPSSFTGTVGAYDEGTQGYQWNDPDGTLTLEFDTIDISSYASGVTVSLAYFIQDTGYESADNFEISVDVDGNVTTLLSYGETELESDNDAWVTLTSGAFTGNSLTLSVSGTTNAGTENFYLDDVVFESVTAVIPEPSTVALLMLGAVAASAASMRSRLG